MFGVKQSESVGFESRWTVRKVYSVGSTQTTEFSSQEATTNTATSEEIEVQTEKHEIKNKEPDMKSLAEWLKKIYPEVKKNIDDSNNSHAFKNYLAKNKFDGDIKVLQKIVVNGVKDKLQVNALSWNSTGKTVAVSCNRSHKSWCIHSGFINIYSFDRFDKLPEKPTKRLTTESCVTTLRFHPNIPSVIATGSYNGEIIIWNVLKSDGENRLANLKMHDEIVMQISWFNDIDKGKSILLASCSLDGFMILYNFSLTSSSLTLKSKYQFKPPLLARIGNKPLEPQQQTQMKRGVISFDFSPHLPETFVVGLEGGLVAQCSTLLATKLRGSTEETPLYDPVYKFYSVIKSEILSISFSKQHKNMFVVNSNDSEIRIYVIGNEEPVRIIFTTDFLHSVMFVPFEEKILTGCGKKGLIEIYNLQNGKRYDTVVKESIESSALTCMEINSQRPLLVAAGNEKGEMQLFHVPWRTFSTSQVEFAK